MSFEMNKYNYAEELNTVYQQGLCMVPFREAFDAATAAAGVNNLMVCSMWRDSKDVPLANVPAAVCRLLSDKGVKKQRSDIPDAVTYHDAHATRYTYWDTQYAKTGMSKLYRYQAANIDRILEEVLGPDVVENLYAQGVLPFKSLRGMRLAWRALPFLCRIQSTDEKLEDFGYLYDGKEEVK